MLLQSLLRYRWLVILSFLLVLAISFVGMGKLGINPNNRVFFGPGDPQYSALVRFESEFGTNTVLLFAISSELNWL